MGSTRGDLSSGPKGSGGPGGGGGYNFQARATAFVYAHVLAGQPLSFAAKHYPVPLAVWAESGGPGDDLRVECQNGIVVATLYPHSHFHLCGSSIPLLSVVGRGSS